MVGPHLFFTQRHNEKLSAKLAKECKITKQKQSTPARRFYGENNTNRHKCRDGRLPAALFGGQVRPFFYVNDRTQMTQKERI